VRAAVAPQQRARVRRCACLVDAQAALHLLARQAQSLHLRPRQPKQRRGRRLRPRLRLRRGRLVVVEAQLAQRRGGGDSPAAARSVTRVLRVSAFLGVC
jgi:hypothetical protein